VSIGGLALALAIAGAVATAQETPPSAATLRSGFEAQYPKSGASAAAIELERLAARLGIDLAPRAQTWPDEEKPAAGEEQSRPEWEPRPTPTPRPLVVDPFKDRPRPTVDAAERLQGVQSELNDFLNREAMGTEDGVGVPPATVVRYMAEQEPTLYSIESLLLRERNVRWELDVTRRFEAQLPNLLGQMRLQRVLAVRALLALRLGDAEAANRTLEASWRFNEGLAARPELISQLTYLAVGKYQVAVLRRFDSPAAGWSDRLRGGRALQAYLVVLQNEFWWVSDASDLTGEKGAWGRALQQVADEIQKRDLCDWTERALEEVWDRALRDQLAEEDPYRTIAEIGAPNVLASFARVQRFLVDAELTALVMDARAERRASPRKEWPERLISLGRGTCYGERWTYRATPKGKATVTFQGTLVPGNSPGIQLPHSYTAGTSARKPTPAPDGSRFADLEGLRVRYKLAGPADGPAVVLVHGWSGSMELWKDQIPALSKHYRVVTLDLPGHGGSDKPRRDYSIDFFAQSVLAVMDDAGVEKAYLVGHSMGTPVVRQVLRRASPRVLGLVAVDGALRPFSTDPVFVERFLAPFKGEKWKEAMDAFVDSSFPAGKTAAREETKAIMTATPQHVVVSAGEGMFDSAVWTEEPIRVPLLLLLAKSPFWSEEYEAFVRKLASDVDWRVFDGVGHFLMLQKPEAINAALLDWLSRRDGG
jgi:pimeloyl-ACP methyl ester carboxylesterase